jgi:addiction module HigA family antidote
LRVLSRCALRVPATRFDEIVHRRRSISAGTALGMARFFGASPQSWMNLQTNCDWEVAADTSGRQIELQVHPCRAA